MDTLLIYNYYSKRSDFICRVRFRNTLPPLNGEPKYLPINPRPERYGPYRQTAFEDERLYEPAFQPEETVPRHALLMEYLEEFDKQSSSDCKLSHTTKACFTAVAHIRNVAKNVETIAPEDAKFLSDDLYHQLNEQEEAAIVAKKVEKAETAGNAPGVAAHLPVLSQKKSINIFHNPKKQGKPLPTTAIAIQQKSRTQTTVTRRNIEKVRDYSTRQKRVAAVENTFKVPELEEIRHPRTGKRAKRVFPLIPDTICRDNIYTVTSFQLDPADVQRIKKRKLKEHQQPLNDDDDEDDMFGDSQDNEQPKLRPSALDATDRGILRPVTNPEDEDDQYLIWFLPNEEGTKKLVEQKTEGPDPAKLAKEVKDRDWIASRFLSRLEAYNLSCLAYIL